MTTIFKNRQLRNDLEKSISYDYYCYTDITTDYDSELGYILDIKDNSYFYANEADRDYDDKAIYKALETKFVF